MTRLSFFIFLCSILPTSYFFDLKGTKIYASPLNHFLPTTIAVAPQAKDKTSPHSHSSKKTTSTQTFQNNPVWALGLMVGQPSGISAQYRLDHAKALQAVLAYGLLQTNLYMGVDYTQNFYRITSLTSDIYWGLGAFAYTYSGPIRHNKNDTIQSSGGLGARLSVGMIYIIPNAPFQIFAESGLRSFLIPNVSLTFDIALGLRYQFH